MADLIDRQEALEGLYDVFFDDELSAAYPKEADKVLDVIRKLPSANYQQVTGKLDCISRQQAIDAVDDYIGTFDAIDVNFLDGLKTAKKLMMQLPSAQPERKTGRWIDNDKINFPQCSECGMWIDVMQQSGEMNYCPNCGADMRGGQDDEQRSN